jgi:hypothetical protein
MDINNKLVLRVLNSPWANDIKTSIDLSKTDKFYPVYQSFDNNFIYLKGETIHTATTKDSKLVINKTNGEDIEVELNLSTDGGSGSEDTYISAFSVPTVKTVGGIPSGTPIEDLTGKTISQIIDLMLFPTQTPSPSGPSTGLVLSGLGSIYQIGQDFSMTFNTSASGGGWSPSTYPGGVTQPSTYAGNVTNAVITYDNTGDEIYTVNGGDLTLSGDYGISDPIDDNYKVVAGNNSWTLTTTFAAGEDAFDSKGDTMVGSGYPGGVKTASDSFQGTYPIYVVNQDGSYRTLPLMTLTTNPVLITIDFEGTASGAANFAFRIPKAFGTPTNIVQKDYQGNWGDVELLNDRWKLTTITIDTDYDTNVEYHQFNWDDSQGKIGPSEFRVTI